MCVRMYVCVPVCLCVSMCVHACVCVCSFLHPLLTLSRRGRTAAFKLRIKIVQADFTDWISFLPPDLKSKLSPNPEALNANT